MKNILDSRVKNYRGYRLQETVFNLKDRQDQHDQIQQIINEIEFLIRNHSADTLLEGSFGGKMLYKFIAKLITTVVQFFGDQYTGDVGGIVMLPAALAKNAYDLNKSNKIIRPIIDKVQQQDLTPKDIADLQELVGEIKGDISDLVRALVIAIPGLGLDEAAGALLGFLEDTSVGSSQAILAWFRSARQRGGLKGMIATIATYVSYFGGGSIFADALDNLIEAEAVLKAGGVKMTTLPAPEIETLEDLQRINDQDSNGLQQSDNIEDVDSGGLPPLDLDSSGDMPEPTRGSHLRIVDADDDLGPNNLAESKINLRRWQKLSGLI